MGCPSAIGWQEELVAMVGRLTTAVLHTKVRFAFVGMFPQLYTLGDRWMKMSMERY
jgi:hypothetical protein